MHHTTYNSLFLNGFLTWLSSNFVLSNNDRNTIMFYYVLTKADLENESSGKNLASDIRITRSEPGRVNV